MISHSDGSFFWISSGMSLCSRPSWYYILYEKSLKAFWKFGLTPTYGCVWKVIEGKHSNGDPVRRLPTHAMDKQCSMSHWTMWLQMRMSDTELRAFPGRRQRCNDCVADSWLLDCFALKGPTQMHSIIHRPLFAQSSWRSQRRWAAPSYSVQPPVCFFETVWR